MFSFMGKKDKKDKKQEEEVAVKEQEQATDAENTQEKAEELSELDQLREEYEKEKDKYLRLFAEFENYKNRTRRERMDLFKTAGQEVMTALLPVIDDFDRALKEIEKSGDDGLYEGVKLISNKLRETLKSKGLEPIGTQVGDTFDADIHEAVTQVPAPNDEMKGKIIDVIETGYKLGDRIIRYPKVVTGQ
jgi:molecular chaperone GrpE